MCTVTYLPTPKGYILTSNRDEQHTRSLALAPQIWPLSGNQQGIFPKDSQAGGSWVGTKDNGFTAVLLNGAFKGHVPQPPYRRSRGLVFLDILAADQPLTAFKEYQLEGIEPFTLILRVDTGLFECRWDGTVAYTRQLDPTGTYIWSSTTLYTQPIIHKRESWFEQWLSEEKNIDQQSIVKFHQFTGDGDPHNDLMMNRSGTVFTVSITSIEVDTNYTKVQYLDLIKQEDHRQQLPLIPHSQYDTSLL
ncbi:transport and Golgi organization protein 2 [Dyadobacter jejuensis]|uniref:Transport and Golgi organization protein 2 n=1 Tax=Dyadobacter jejuensis TaxID=1082580 RepID=A0A316ALW7_9BACT|nr:NRDE family protein [Dyadobacter jejuensis]PWJ58785.1 transport and Golgi organization protein 2 [Dyadobacter jejuensis]